MVIKSAQIGVPIIVSRSGITQMGYELASKLGLALFGRATNKHFICYCGFERFEAEPLQPPAWAAEGPGRSSE
jgi:FdhD protein